MILYRLMPDTIKRVMYYPHSQMNRIVVDKPKHKFGTKEFRSLVNKTLKPKLKEIGYNGHDLLYFRPLRDRTETLLLGISPYGKAICVNAEIRPAESKKIIGDEPSKRNWKRLSPDSNDCWWWFRKTESENLKVIDEMLKLILFEGESYFKKQRVD